MRYIPGPVGAQLRRQAAYWDAPLGAPVATCQPCIEPQGSEAGKRSVGSLLFFRPGTNQDLHHFRRALQTRCRQERPAVGQSDIHVRAGGDEYA